MGFVKPILFAIVALSFYKYYFKVEPVPISSVKIKVEKGWEKVGEKFKELVLEGEIRGSSISIRHKGKEVVNIVGGYADKDSFSEWDFETLSLMFSSSKIYGATVILLMAERKQLSLDDKISKHWPEFGKNGKEDITISDILTHRSCLYIIEENYDPADLIDNPEAIQKIFEDQMISCEVGKDIAYHALTFGVILDLIVRKTDSKGRSLSQYFREEIGIPHNLDTYIGLPNEENFRTTRMEKMPIFSLELLRADAQHYRQLNFNLLMDPTSNAARALKYPSVYFTEFSINNPKKRRAPDCCCFGFSTTSSMTNFLSLIQDGQILKKETANLLPIAQVDGYNIIVDERTKFSHGFFINDINGRSLYGHPGAGGQALYADKENDLTFAYLTNYPTIYSRGDDPRFLQMVDVAYDCFKNATK